jgi:hypothetical protein
VPNEGLFNTQIAPLAQVDPIVTVVITWCEADNCENKAKWEVSSWDAEAAAAGEGAAYYTELCDEHLMFEEGDCVTKLEVA